MFSAKTPQNGDPARTIFYVVPTPYPTVNRLRVWPLARCCVPIRRSTRKRKSLLCRKARPLRFLT